MALAQQSTRQAPALKAASGSFDSSRRRPWSVLKQAPPCTTTPIFGPRLGTQNLFFVSYYLRIMRAFVGAFGPYLRDAV